MEFIRVNDEFVQLAAPAVLWCRLRSGADLGHDQQDGRLTIEWFTSDGHQVGPGEISKGNKLVAFETGELHVINVEMADLRRTYGCRLRNSTSKRVLSTSNSAQLILIDQIQQSPGYPGGPAASDQAPLDGQVLHTIEQTVALDADFDPDHPHAAVSTPSEPQQRRRPLLLPCAARLPHQRLAKWTRWVYQAPRDLQQAGAQAQARPVSLDQLASAHNKWLQVVDSRASGRGFSADTSPANENSASRLLVGPTYLAIERPRARLSGRYVLQLLTDTADREADDELGVARTLCDIRVIIRQPIELKVGPVLGASVKQQQQEFALDELQAQPLVGDARDQPASLLGRLISWFRPGGSGRARRSAAAQRIEDSADKWAGSSQNAPLDDDVTRIRVSGPGSVPAAPIVRLGERLELECQASGYPIDSVRWFRQGRAINTQSSADFQTELSTSSDALQVEDNRTSTLGARSGRGQRASLRSANVMRSRLLIRRLQARDLGLVMFECFAQNAQGDRARAGQLVLVAEREQVAEARATCPLDSAPTSGPLERLDPFKAALVLEGDAIELECPAAGETTAGAGPQVEWFRWRPGSSGKCAAVQRFGAPLVVTGEDGQLTNLYLDSAPEASGQATPPARDQDAPAERTHLLQQFNQLFGGDSRFVINGSSLQIRSPSERHDATLFVCVRRWQARGAGQPQRQRRARRQTTRRALHQSSSASSCLEALFYSAAGGESADVKQQRLDDGRFLSADDERAGKSPARPPLVSSISIRIVAKPRVDPFEFSRNLEEGMRTVVVCTVVSGQSLVEINWFKDGELLIGGESDEIRIDYANSFSSTLTFHKIRPHHSGHYTCIASNALAAAEHTSRLLVNVAPFFVELPRSQRVYLGTNVLINCRAGGQPSPQIRWRKLMPVAMSPSAGATESGVAISRQSPGAPQASSAKSMAALGLDSSLLNEFATDQQMSPLSTRPIGSSQQQQMKHEFRIITSNSHIQILENGSMIIKEVELADAARYSCQASNGIQPILSEVIDLTVLQPAQFDIDYETVSVKRDSNIRFACAPRGDQPLRIDWFKEGVRLVPQASGDLGDSNHSTSTLSKYSELVHLVALATPAPDGAARHLSARNQTQALTRRQQLVDVAHANSNQNVNQLPTQSRNSAEGSGQAEAPLDGLGMQSSELLISAADRSDSGVFVCQARNAYGRDELTYRLVVQEPPDAPYNLQLQSIQAQSLKLLWQTPFDGNIPISHYIIEYRRLHEPSASLSSGGLAELSSGGYSPSTSQGLAVAGSPAGSSGDWMRVVVSNEQQLLLPPPPPPQSSSSGGSKSPAASGSQVAQMNSATLERLSAKRTYQIRVAAVNPIGQGLFSPIQLITTAEEPPQARPADLHAAPLSSTAVKLHWRGPMPAEPDDPAPVRGYHVSFRRAIGASDSSPGSANKWSTAMSISANNYTTTSGAGGAGAGLNSPNSSESAAAKLASYELTLAQLEKNTKYEVRVQPFNSMGVGPQADLVVQTLRFDRPGQPALKLVAARKQSLELKWSMSQSAATVDKDSSELLGFSLYYKCEYDDWQEIQLSLIFHYVIEGLRCGNKYQIYLSAFNSVGRSDPSDVLSVRTEGTTPIAPDKNHFFKLNTTEVALDMSQWSSGGCQITSFMIQFKRLHDSNWFILSEGATPFTQADRITIPDLTPATWYKLLVTALNEAGSTNAEYVFGTLTPDGQLLEPPSYLLEQSSNHQLYAGERRTFGSLFSALGQLLFGGGGSKHEEAQLLFPLSCLLLLLVGSLASYLYCSRAHASPSKSSQLSAADKTKTHSSGPSDCNGHLRASSAAQLQLIDRHLLHANCQAAESSSSSSSTSVPHHNQNPAHQQQLSNFSATLARGEKQQLIQSDGLLLTSKSQLLPLDASSSPRSDLNESHWQHQQLQANYVLDSFLDQQQQQQLQTSSFVCPAVGSATLQHNHSSTAMGAGKCRTATMKLFAGGASSVRSSGTGSYCLDGAASSSSGLGSVKTTATSNGSADNSQSNFQLINGLERQQQCPQQTQVSPAHYAHHVDLVQQPHDSQNNHADHHYNTGQLTQMFAQAPGGTYTTSGANYASASSHQQRSMVGSSSFVSAADLMARQQQQSNEPIYQQLDKFKGCALPACRQFATLNPHLSSKIKQNFNAVSRQLQNCSLDDQFVFAGQQQQQQWPECSFSHQEANQQTSNFEATNPLDPAYYPPPPPQVQTTVNQFIRPAQGDGETGGSDAAAADHLAGLFQQSVANFNQGGESGVA